MDEQSGTQAGSTACCANTAGVAVRLSRFSKAYRQRPVLQQVSLDVAPGEFVALIGRSGCGKSTLLRHIAGLERADSGSVMVDGLERTRLQDDTRLVFQEARLLPWKRVWQNVGLGLAGQARACALAALDDVGLADRADDWPATLSGGQRQRVALARALVHAPRLLLLDEPLGALDALTRIEMQQLIERLWLRQGFTVLMVTHDVSEAVALADRVVLIENGALALDVAVPCARPRERASSQFAALEGAILQRILGRAG